MPEKNIQHGQWVGFTYLLSLRERLRDSEYNPYNVLFKFNKQTCLCVSIPKLLKIDYPVFPCASFNR